MGTKGTQTSQTNQTQNYAPTGAGYLTSALNQGAAAAQLPFNIPQAPVAGFSQDQQSAFNTTNQAQGAAQPYYNQAQSLYGQAAQQPNVANFYNPMASAVNAQLQNTFGMQASQNTGQLTQAAGGVGADRIGVGQAQLANQQGLAQGQTDAGLYAQAQTAAQAQQQAQLSAGNAMQGLGSNVENTMLSGAQAQLGTGGLQQQLSQAQLNAPYQQQLAQAAFPYQQAQFGAGIAGALAPALGGTTTGQGNTTSQYNPSLLGQIGGGLSALGGLGGYLGSGSKGSKGGTPGTSISGAAGPTSLGGSAGPTPLVARGGTINGYASGGGSGGGVGGSVYSLPSGADDQPINVQQTPIIPQGSLPQAQTHMPNLNLNPPAASTSGSGSKGSSASSVASGVGTAAKIAGMFLRRGGAINPYADGGSTSDDVPDFADRWAGLGDAGVVNPDNPFRMVDQGATDNWRKGVDADKASGKSATSDNPATDMALSFAGKDAAPAAAGSTPPSAAPAAAPAAAASPAPDAGASAAPSPSSDTGLSLAGFLKSPYAALTAGGLEAMRSGSLGEGLGSAIKFYQGQQHEDDTVKEAADRLKQEAKFHQDQYTKMTPGQQGELDVRKGELKQKQEYQQFEMSKPVPMGQRIDPQTGQSITTFGIRQPDGSFKPANPAGGPPGPAAPGPAAAADDNSTLPTAAKPTQGFMIPGKDVPDNVDPTVLEGVDPGLAGTVRAIDEGRESISHVPMKQRYMVQRLLNQYDPGFDGTTWNLRNKMQGDLSSNGNAGKLLLATNQLLPHLATASEKAMDLANSNYPEANTIKNWWMTATGDPRVKQFQTVREVASMDAARLLRGSGQMAEKDIEEWRKNISEAGSPQQLQGVIKMLGDELVGARIESIKGLYKMNMRHEPPEFLFPESKAALEKIRANNAAVNAPPRGAPATPAGGPTPPAGGATPPAPAGGAAPAAPALRPPTPSELGAARDAVNTKGRDAVIKRMQSNGIDPSGL
jgi:hypothetical protein